MKLIIVWAMLSAAATSAQTSVRSAVATCHPGNLNEEPSDTAQAIMSFYTELREAVLAGDKQRVSRMMEYPLHVGTARGKLTIRSQAEFIRRYGVMFSPRMKDLIRAQTASCVSRVGVHGFSISSGELWFDIFPDGKVRVMTVNAVLYPGELTTH